MALAVLAGCASAPPGSEPPEAPPAQGDAPPAIAAPAPSKGGYYKDDGPGDSPPPNLAAIPDAVPAPEPLHRYANRPYTVFGQAYVPLSTLQPYKQRGRASWYGRRFHGKKTSIGETYDMYAMSAAHPTLPLPSYARVTNLANGRSVVVRVNDRGPFHARRIIDLSYAAAHRLGYVNAGSAEVEVESILPGPAQKPSHYIQVGAFASADNAEQLRARVRRELAWLAEAQQVLEVGALWRLYVGPYGSEEAARAVAERIQGEMNLKPMVIVR